MLQGVIKECMFARRPSRNSPSLKTIVRRPSRAVVCPRCSRLVSTRAPWDMHYKSGSQRPHKCRHGKWCQADPVCQECMETK